MLERPYCRASKRQIKAGRNRAGSQRFQCREGDRHHYTPEPKPNGYPEEVRLQAVRLYLEGTNFRRIGRLLSVNHQSVVNWINAKQAALEPAPQPVAEPETVELDEMFTFIGTKKKPVYIATAVARASRCIIGWAVVWERTTEALQQMLDATPPAISYFSDALPTYFNLCYWGTDRVAPGKAETYSVEGTNADLRHYLARLVRKSRCFSRCIHALRRAVELFVHFYNQRQMRKRARPRYPAHIIDALPIRV